MKKTIIIAVSLIIVFGMLLSLSFSATKEANSRATTKKVMKEKRPAAKKFTTSKNDVLNTKELQRIKEKTTIIKSPTCECAPQPDPRDVHPSTQF